MAVCPLELLPVPKCRVLKDLGCQHVGSQQHLSRVAEVWFPSEEATCSDLRAEFSSARPI